MVKSYGQELPTYDPLLIGLSMIRLYTDMPENLDSEGASKSHKVLPQPAGESNLKRQVDKQTWWPMHKSINVLKYPKRQIMILYILHQKHSLICLKTHGSLKMLSKTTTAGQVSIPWLSILCTTTHTVDASHFGRWCFLQQPRPGTFKCHGVVINDHFQRSWKKLHGLPLPFLDEQQFHEIDTKAVRCCRNDQKVWWPHSDMILPLPSHKVPACAVYHQCEHSVPQACTYKSS